MKCLIERLMTLEAVIELKETTVSEWGGEVTTYTDLLTTKAAFVNDSTSQHTERLLSALVTGYTENTHVVYIPYSDVPKEEGKHMLKVDGKRYPIVGVLNMSALNQWTELVLAKGEPVA